MSLDFPNRKKWLARRNTQPTEHRLSFIAARFVERMFKEKDADGKPVEVSKVVQEVKTYNVGRNQLKAKLGHSNRRKHVRVAVMRAAEGGLEWRRAKLGWLSVYDNLYRNPPRDMKHECYAA